MKIIAKSFLLLGILFWGISLIYSFSKLIALNGVVDIFEMKEAQRVKTKINQELIDIRISYTYQVDEKEYNDNYTMFIDYFERCNIDTIVIKYNETFPMVSYIEGVPLKNRKQKTGIFISSFFLLFLVLIWKLSNRNKWIKTYEEVGRRPWLYPNDKTIKNPWKRFKNRLFHK
jgi:hypothetical protein